MGTSKCTNIGLTFFNRCIALNANFIPSTNNYQLLMDYGFMAFFDNVPDLNGTMKPPIKHFF